MATSRLLSLEVVEGGPRADEVDLWENTKKNNEDMENTIYKNIINLCL